MRINTSMTYIFTVRVLALCFVLLLQSQGVCGQSVNQHAVLDYDDYGNALQVKDANGNITNYYYGSNSNPFSQGGMNGILGVYLTGIQKVKGGADAISGGVRPSGGDDLFIEARYDSRGRLKELIDENEKKVIYHYDNLGRLISIINQNGKHVSSYVYAYSVTINDGNFVSASPNQIEAITYIEPLYYTDFSSNEGWTGDISSAAFGQSIGGEIAMRLGTNSSNNWKAVTQTPNLADIIVRADFYATPSLGGEPHVLMLNGNGGYRFSVDYNASSDRFIIEKRLIPSGDYINEATLPLAAPPNQWYTIEIEKKGGDITGWVYQRGQWRNPANSFTISGYPSSWEPLVQAQTNQNYIYLANLSFARSSLSNISYLDGLGREIQTQQRGGGQTIIAGMRYNDRGLPEAVSRPIELSNQNTFLPNLFEGSGSFNPPGALPASSPVQDYWDAQSGISASDANYAYSYSEYEASPLSRVLKSTLPGYGHRYGQGKELTTTYGLNSASGEIFATSAQGSTPAKNWGQNTLQKIITQDPDGKKTITYINGWGQTIASGVDMNNDGKLTRSSTDLVTEFAYDILGNVVRIEDPRGLVTSYTYDALGQLKEKKLPDQSLTNKYRYDNKGRLRFFKDSNIQAAGTNCYFNYYDELDRLINTMRFNNNCNWFDSQTAANNQIYPTTWRYNLLSKSYDGENAKSSAKNLKGRLSNVRYRDFISDEMGDTWYSYNDLGLVEWIIQKIPGLIGEQKIEYLYDGQGKMIRVYFNPPGTHNDYYFWYYYDDFGRLTRVTSHHINSESLAITEAEYNYYADGQLKQLKLGEGVQTVDYTYTIQGWLDKINNPTSLGNDKFGLDLGYSYNGNISQQQWKQAGASNTNLLTYNYSYDTANRLTLAQFSGSGYTAGRFNEELMYDKNGNITFIARNPNNSELGINIASGSNRIQSVSNYDLFVSEDVAYDANGNVILNETQGISAIAYDWRNLPTNLTKGSSVLKYAYDGNGNRVRKQIVGGSGRFYVRDAFGQTIAVYDEMGNLLYLNIIANGEILGQIGD